MDDSKKIVQFRPVNAESLFEGVKPDRSVLNGSASAPPDFPAHLFQEAGLWAQEVAESKACPVDYVVGGALAATAATVGNTRYVSPWEGWREPCALWVGLMGEPSSGKTPALSPILEALREIESGFSGDFDQAQIQYETRLAEARAVRDAWTKRVEDAVKDGQSGVPEMPGDAVMPDPPAQERLCVSDVTVEALVRCEVASPRGLLVNRDELTGLIANFARYGGDDRGYYLEGWNGGPHTVERVKLDRPIYVPRHLISIVGGIQPEKFRELFGRSSDDGFPARLAMFWPERVAFRRPTTTTGLGKFSRAISGLHSAVRFNHGEDGKLEPVTLSLTPDAANVFEAWGRKNDAEIVAATGLLKSHFGKLQGWALRLALVMEHLEYGFGDSERLPTEIGERSVTNACSFIEDYLRPMARRVYGAICVQKDVANAQGVLKEMQRRKARIVNRREVRRSWGVPGLSTPEAASEAFKLLEETGWIVPVPSEGVGRASADYHVNPALLAATNA